MLTLKLPLEDKALETRKGLASQELNETLLVHICGTSIAVGLYCLACLIEHLKG